jgi:hypothetical protein
MGESYQSSLRIMGLAGIKDGRFMRIAHQFIDERILGNNFGSLSSLERIFIVSFENGVPKLTL